MPRYQTRRFDRILWFAISLLILSSLACNAFAGDSPEPALTLPPPPVSETDVTPLPDTGELGLAPTATLPGAVTDVPLVDAEGNPLLEALVDVNIRTGPGVQYNRDGFLFAGETARAIGRDPVSGWWKIECPGRATGPECWVSGGTQYTKVTNSEGVPIAAAPPTPTPKPSPTPAAAPDSATSIAVNGLLVYTDHDGLWLMTLDMSQPLPVAGEIVQLSAADAERPFISPDGRKVAYMTSSDEASALYVVDVDGNNDRMLITSADLPVNVEADTAVHIGQVQWLADSQGLAFNTYMLSLIGPGSGEREDLWTISLDGTLTQRFDAGEGGGTFDISPSNQVIFGQTEAIVRANLDGSAVEEVVSFDFVNTASEYAYSPYPQWVSNGSFALVAIPAGEQWNADAHAVLWRIPADGPAELLESLTGNILFDPVYWSPDGNILAYVQQEINATNPSPVLTLAEGDGRNPGPYTSDSQLALYGWSPDGAHFLYAGSSEYAVGQVGAPPTKYPMQGTTGGMQWLNESTFITAIGGPGVWNLRSNNINGELDLLTIADDEFVYFNVWVP